MSILKVEHLSKLFSFGFWPFQNKETFIAVNNISFQLGKGEILGLLGANGAGKTTTIQMLLGTLTPTSGSIEYFGLNFLEHRINALKKIGFASGYDRLPARLSVYENLAIIGRIYGMSSAQRAHQIEKLLKFFCIWHLKDRQTGTLSAGQATRVMLTKAFLAEPAIVLLDEPTASLDPDIASEVREFILAQRKEQEVSILITSHNMDEVTLLCDRVLVLQQGSIIADDTPQLLAQSISKVKMHLDVSQNLQLLLQYAGELNVSYTIYNTQVTIELDEQAIASFLSGLAEHNVNYVAISIDKPTLEDYFLTISQKGKL